MSRGLPPYRRWRMRAMVLAVSRSVTAASSSVATDRLGWVGLDTESAAGGKACPNPRLQGSPIDRRTPRATCRDPPSSRA
jgi:hypothetical protein